MSDETDIQPEAIEVEADEPAPEAPARVQPGQQHEIDHEGALERGYYRG